MTTADYPEDLKRRFALEWYRAGDDRYFAAAYNVIGHPANENAAAVTLAAERLVKDPFVLQEKERIRQGASTDDALPTKNDVGLAIWRKLTNEEAPVHIDYWLKGMRLFAEMRGYLQKPNEGLPQHSESETTVDWSNVSVETLRQLRENIK